MIGFIASSIITLICYGLYHSKVESLNAESAFQIALSVLSLKSLISFVYHCTANYDEMVRFLSDDTMFICTVALTYVVWLSLSPIMGAIRQLHPAQQ